MARVIKYKGVKYVRADSFEGDKAYQTKLRTLIFDAYAAEEAFENIYKAVQTALSKVSSAESEEIHAFKAPLEEYKNLFKMFHKRALSIKNDAKKKLSS